MTTRDTLTFQRHLPCPQDRAYRALITPAARQLWCSPDADSVFIVESPQDPAPGLRETGRVGPRENPYVDVWTDWVLLEPGARVTYVETLSAEGEVLGVSFAEAEMAAEGTGTALTLTVRLTSYVGDEMANEIRDGWTHAVERLSDHLVESPVH